MHVLLEGTAGSGGWPRPGCHCASCDRARVAGRIRTPASVHPATSAGRRFRDQLGWLNQRLAAECEEAVLMVAGRALSLPS